MSLFSRSASPGEDEDKKDIFAPVADLMVGVVFIFIILMLALRIQREDTVARSEDDWQVAQVHALEAEVAELRARNQVLSQSNARLVEFVRFVRDNNVMRLMAQLANANQERNRLLEEVRSKLADATKIDVTVNRAAGTLMLPARRLFDIGRADPTLDGRKIIIQLGAVLADVLPCYSIKVTQANTCRGRSEASQLNAVYVEGHTDVTPFGAAGGRFSDNWDLSAGRAIEAYKLISMQFESLRVLRNRDG